jgi:glycosyltransferase involved in cell wall biosynthesis
MLDHITPVLLTYNEEQNITRTLSRLAWARDIVVVDSGSTDGTLAALAHFPNVRVFNRRFDTHGKQWRYATEATNIATDWLLRLDADYQMSDALIAELGRLDPKAAVSAYRVRFDYASSHASSFRRFIHRKRSFCGGAVSRAGQGALRCLGRAWPRGHFERHYHS